MSSPRSIFPERSRWTRLLGMDGLALSDWQRLFTPTTHRRRFSIIKRHKSPLDVLTAYWRKWKRKWAASEDRKGQDQNVKWKHRELCKCNTTPLPVSRYVEYETFSLFMSVNIYHIDSCLLWCFPRDGWERKTKHVFACTRLYSTECVPDIDILSVQPLARVISVTWPRHWTVTSALWSSLSLMVNQGTTVNWLMWSN